MPDNINARQCDQLFTSLYRAHALVAGLSALCDVHVVHPAIEELTEMLVNEIESAKEAVGIA